MELRIADLRGHWSLKHKRSLSPGGEPQWSVPQWATRKPGLRVKWSLVQRAPGGGSGLGSTSQNLKGLPNTCMHAYARTRTHARTHTHTGVQASLTYKHQPFPEVPPSQCVPWHQPSLPLPSGSQSLQTEGPQDPKIQGPVSIAEPPVLSQAPGS